MSMRPDGRCDHSIGAFYLWTPIGRGYGSMDAQIIATTLNHLPREKIVWEVSLSGFRVFWIYSDHSLLSHGLGHAR